MLWHLLSVKPTLPQAEPAQAGTRVSHPLLLPVAAPARGHRQAPLRHSGIAAQPCQAPEVSLGGAMGKFIEGKASSGSIN